ncbi:hypothetical protein TRFO_17251 [Tritrichomonas foetus]|uniref:Uncharacterized protein n=1 Tax=Tritrichomonas foetus TaxID=1144522 RepID=A0A1J4KT04_9EUKA|nr:hypothetical protein TRFO_17251 [Tritrichomonas foetus]|eukprot:OHT12790.1 hypothetical protein TRFO_17251 [Tritrichomonas foetus]
MIHNRKAQKTNRKRTDKLFLHSQNFCDKFRELKKIIHTLIDSMYEKLKFISSSSQENTIPQNLRDSHQESISSPLQLFFQKNIHSIILPEKIDPEMIRQTAHSFSMPISKSSDINEDIYYVVPKEKLLFINSSKKMPIEKPQKVAISRDSLLKLLDLLTEHSEDHGYLFFKEIIDHFQQKFHLTNNSETTISFFNSQINHKQIKQIIDFFKEKSVTEVPEKKNIKENYSVFIEIISALLLYLDYGNLTQTLSFDRLYKLLMFFYGGKVTNNEKNEIIIKLNHFFLQEWLNSIRNHLTLNAEQIRFLNFFIYVNQIEEEKFALLMKGTVINDNDQVTKRLTFQIKKQLITNDSFLNYRLCVFDPYRTFLHNYHIDPQRFCIISNKPDLLFSKIKVLSHYASVLLNPKNDYFDFNHIWNNKLIKRNNLISVFKRDNQKRFIPHYLVLKYYPVFYNALKQYCLRESVYPYYSIKGSPGTGKTTMLIYIVLRWYQQQDLFNQNHELVDTIMIKPSKQNIINAFLFFQLEKDVFKFGIIVKDYWHHFNCDHTPIVMYLVDRNTNQSILYDENNPILATKKIRIDYEKALYIFDEYEDPVYGSDFKRLILNSIGSKKRNKDIETETSIFTFLPSMEEMKMLKKLIKDSSDKQHFKETMTLVGSNIRKCISKEAIKNLIKEGIERFSDRHHFSEQLELMLQPEKYLLTESSQYSVNSTLIQIT